VSRPEPESLLAGEAAPGGLAATISSLQSRLREARDDWRSYASLGLAYLQQARITADPSFYDKAEGVLRRSLELKGSGNYEAMLGLGSLAATRHDFSGALEWGRRAKSVDPYSAEARGLIGDALIELGRYRAGVSAYQDMIDLRPGLSAYARVSYARELTGDTKGAIAAMKLADQAATGSPHDGAWVGYQLGELHFGQGRLDQARRAYAKGAALAPDYLLNTAGLAKIAAARGHHARAASLLESVVAQYPSPELLILAGDVNSLAGRHAKAREMYELVRVTERLYAAGGVDTDLEMALFNADHGVALGDALADARAQYRKRPSILVADALAWTLYANGRYDAARRKATEALRLGTKSALLNYHAGMIAFRGGRAAEARRHLAEALALNPDFSFIHADSARSTLARL